MLNECFTVWGVAGEEEGSNTNKPMHARNLSVHPCKMKENPIHSMASDSKK